MLHHSHHNNTQQSAPHLMSTALARLTRCCSTDEVATKRRPLASTSRPPDGSATGPSSSQNCSTSVWRGTPYKWGTGRGRRLSTYDCKVLQCMTKGSQSRRGINQDVISACGRPSSCCLVNKGTLTFTPAPDCLPATTHTDTPLSAPGEQAGAAAASVSSHPSHPAAGA